MFVSQAIKTPKTALKPGIFLSMCVRNGLKVVLL